MSGIENQSHLQPSMALWPLWHVADVLCNECGIPKPSAVVFGNPVKCIDYVKTKLEELKTSATTDEKVAFYDLQLRRLEAIDKIQNATSRVLKMAHKDLQAFVRLDEITKNLTLLGAKIVAQLLLMDQEKAPEQRSFVTKAVEKINELKALLEKSPIPHTPRIQRADQFLQEVENEKVLQAVENEKKRLSKKVHIPEEVIGLMAAYLQPDEAENSIPPMIEVLSKNAASQKNVKKIATQERAGNAHIEQEKVTIVNAISYFIEGRTNAITLPPKSDQIGAKLYCLEGLNAALRGATKDQIPTIISFLAMQCPQLYTLDFTNTKVDIQTIKLLSQFKRLENLYFSHCSSLIDDDLQPMSTLPRLHFLDFQYCKNLTDKALQYIGTCRDLRELNLRGCNEITDVGMSAIAPLVHLTSLNLACDDTEHRTRITTAGLEVLSRMTKLRELSLDGRDISESVLYYLGNCKQLEVFDFNRCLDLTDNGIGHLSELTSLKRLVLHFCMGVTDKGFSQLAALVNLEELELSYSNISHTGLSCVKCMPKLRVLDLLYCGAIGDEISELLAHMPQLEDLRVNHGTKITEAGYAQMKKMHPRAYIQWTPRDLDVDVLSDED